MHEENETERIVRLKKRAIHSSDEAGKKKSITGE